MNFRRKQCDTIMSTETASVKQGHKALHFPFCVGDFLLGLTQEIGVLDAARVNIDIVNCAPNARQKHTSRHISVRHDVFVSALYARPRQRQKLYAYIERVEPAVCRPFCRLRKCPARGAAFSTSVDLGSLYEFITIPKASASRSMSLKSSS